MTVTLREIDRDNFARCIKLEVNDEQRSFVASNLYSIAQSKVEPTYKPEAIYDDEELVGFIMYGYDTDERCHWVARLMIDRNHQGKGYGRAAMVEAIRRMRADSECREIGLSIEPENETAQKLYESLGFKKTGQVVENEEVMRLKFNE